MQYLKDWATFDRRSLLVFEESVLEVFEAHRQIGPQATESGGILLGHVRGDHLEVLHATKPSTRDRRHRYLFEREQFWHQTEALRIWKESRGLVRYLGEWHTHPEKYPTPSSLDRAEWEKLATKRADGRPVLVVVVGTHGLCVEQAAKGFRCAVMFPVA